MSWLIFHHLIFHHPPGRVLRKLARDRRQPTREVASYIAGQELLLERLSTTISGDVKVEKRGYAGPAPRRKPSSGGTKTNCIGCRAGEVVEEKD
jgi:hypothetical protein